MIRINEIYMKDEVIHEMKSFFEKEGFIQLVEFFDDKVLDSFMTKINETEMKKVYRPSTESYSELEISNVYELEILKLVEFLKSDDFIGYIEEVCDLDLELKSFSIKKFEHGDYTILSDTKKREECIDIILDLTEEWFVSSGGTLTYTTKEEEVLYLEPRWNTVSIIYRPDELMKFLKYINNKAEKRKIMRIEMELDIV